MTGGFRRGAGLTVAVLTAGAVVVVLGILSKSPVPKLDPAPGDRGDPVLAARSGDVQGAPADLLGDHDKVQRAIRQLIAANQRTADQHERDDVVHRTYEVGMSSTMNLDTGAETQKLVLVVQEIRNARGATRWVRQATIAIRQPTSDRAAMREWARQELEAANVDAAVSSDSGRELEGRFADMFLRQAESESRSKKPVTHPTERPDQAHAFIAAADALRGYLQPADRTRALRAIGRIDDQFTEYRGRMMDLLGEEGVAISGYDPARRWFHVLIFDTQTGALLGEYQHAADPDAVQIPISGYSAHRTSAKRTESGRALGSMGNRRS